MNQLTIVNGANIIGRSIIRRLAPDTKKVKLLDIFPYRQSVYKLQEELKGKVDIDKTQVYSHVNLNKELEGAEKVIYVTHDYFSNASAKTSFLQATAEAAARHGVKNLICVAPIEFDMYHTEHPTKSPVDLRNESEEKAREKFPALTVLRPNLLIGNESYLVRLMLQSILDGSIRSLLSDGAPNNSYYPITIDDVTAAVKNAYENAENTQGKTYALIGKNPHTIKEIYQALHKYAGHRQVEKSSGAGIRALFDDFMFGMTHESNLLKMVQFYGKESTNFAKEENYFQKFGLKQEGSLESVTQGQIGNEEDFVFPLKENYRKVELD